MQVTLPLLEALEGIARDAGRAIMEVYKGDVACWTKGDDSPLTEADLRADCVIRSSLQTRCPDIPILSEESVSSEIPVDADRFFLVDPLDGTKEFLKRNGEFTVNIALIDKGQLMAGVVYAPALNALYIAGRGLEAWRKDGAGSMVLSAADAPRNELRIIGSRSHAGEGMNAWLENLPQPYRFLTAGSSLKFCRVAEGEADIYPRFGLTSQWDTAAGQCVLEVAGGKVMSIDGAPLCYGLDLPILNPYFFACSAGHAELCMSANSGY